MNRQHPYAIDHLGITPWAGCDYKPGSSTIKDTWWNGTTLKNETGRQLTGDRTA